jgi:hypothetical protein
MAKPQKAKRQKLTDQQLIDRWDNEHPFGETPTIARLRQLESTYTRELRRAEHYERMIDNYKARALLMDIQLTLEPFGTGIALRHGNQREVSTTFSADEFWTRLQALHQRILALKT